MRILSLTVLALSLSTLVFGFNPASGPPPPPKDPKDVDPCKKSESELGSFMYSLDWGGIPMQSGLSSGRFIIRENQPSPAMFTSSVVYYQHPAAVKLIDFVNNGVTITASIIGSDSLLVQFAVTAGQMSGTPIGQQIASGQRLILLGALGEPLVAEANVTPVALRVFNPDGSSVDINVNSKAATSYRTPSGREIVFADLPSSLALKLIYKDGALRQIRAATGLADLAPRGTSGFEIRLYSPGNEGTVESTTGLYVPTGTPYRAVFFENPNASSDNYETIKITDSWGTQTKVDIFTYDTVINDWRLSRGTAGLRRESKTLIPGPNIGESTYHTTLVDNAQKLISSRDEIYTVFTWGRQKTAEILEPGTLNLKTTYDFNKTTPSLPGYGKLHHVIKPDESWEAYEYDAAGRVLSKSTGWKDSVYSASRTSQRKIVSYDYTPLDADDIVPGTDLRPRTETESIIPSDGDAPIIVGRTFHVYKIDGAGQAVKIEERASSASSSYSSPSNRRTTLVYYTNDPTRVGYNEVSAGQLYYEDLPDGMRTTYSYTRDLASLSAAFITTATRATAASPAGIEGLSTRTVASYNLQGYLVRRQSYIYANSAWQPTTDVVETVSNTGRTMTRTVHGRQVYAATYDGELMTSETDESGVTTTYLYDTLEKIYLATRRGVPASGGYAAQADIKIDYQRSLGGLSCGCDGDVITTVFSGELSLKSTARKDPLGRIVYEKNSAGLETDFIYTLGGRQITRLNPNSGSVTILNYRDGRIQSESGSGTNTRVFDYGVNTDGSQWTLVTRGERKERSTNDFLGRPFKEEQPSADGGMLVITQTYDDNGRLARTHRGYVATTTGTETRVMADTLYVYDVLGNLIRTGLDTDGNNSLTPVSADRMIDTQTTFGQYESAWWTVQKTLVYPELNSGTLIQVSETRRRLSGFTGTLAEESVSIDIQGNVTRRKTNVDPTAKLVAQTVAQPDSNITATQVTYNGLLVAENSTTVSFPTIYVYDTLGRRVAIKEPRKVHADTTVYDATTGQIRSIVDAAGNTTTVAYYPSGVAGAGQPSLVTDASGKTQRLAYDLQGRVIYQWGTAIYPQAVSYDISGEVASSTTWRDNGTTDLNSTAWPALTAGDVTAWTYDPSSWLLTRKTYADGNGTDYVYDNARRLLTRTLSRNAASTRVTTTYGLDANTGDMLTVSYNDGTPSVTVTYDRLGREVAVADAAGIRTLAYDSTRLYVVKETLPATYFGSRVLTFDYQPIGPGNLPGRYVGFRLGTAGAPSQDFTGAYSFDAQGRFASVVSGAGAFTYTYISSSDLLARVTGPKVTATYAYETDRDVRTQVTNAVGGTSISRTTYAVDSIGRRSNRVQDGTACAGSTYDRFDYSHRSELTGSRNYTGTTPANYLTDTQFTALARVYTYDSIGNRISSAEGTSTARTYTASALNQYSAITNPATAPTFDLDGNQIFNGAGWYHSWDAESRLINARNFASTPVAGSQKIDFAYDYLSRRIRRTLSTYASGAWSAVDDRKFIYQNWNVVAEINANTNNLLVAYTWGLDLSQSLNGAGGVGGLLAITTQSPSATSFFATYDGNGNVSEYINNSGAIEAHFSYDAFGQTIMTSGNGLNRFVYRFSTKYEEPQLGLYYYGFRYYSPSIARWLSRDPIEEHGGTNLYGFVKNAPTSSVDPLGKESWQINEDNCTMEMTWNVKLRFVSDYNDWTDDRINSFKTSFVQGVEHDWNSSNIAFVPKNPTGKCCKKCPKGLRPRLKINLVDSSNADWSPRVWPNAQGLKDPFNNTVRPDVSNLNEASNSDAFIQYGGHRSSSHEFGHSIGLMHPGYYRVWQISRWGQNEYHFKGTDYFGHEVDGNSELMGAGNGMRTFYYEKWKTALNAKYPDCPYEIIPSL